VGLWVWVLYGVVQHVLERGEVTLLVALGLSGYKGPRPTQRMAARRVAKLPCRATWVLRLRVLGKRCCLAAGGHLYCKAAQGAAAPALRGEAAREEA